jgi:hypothetical protein
MLIFWTLYYCCKLYQLKSTWFSLAFYILRNRHKKGSQSTW